MNRKLLLFSLCVGTFVYSLVSIIGGQNGIWAYTQLQKQKNLLLENVSYIETLNEMLKTKHALLKQDPEVLGAYAKRLGFIHEGEKLIKITGLPITPEKVDETGVIYMRGRIQHIPEWLCKVLGIVFFLVSYLFSVFKKFSVKNSLVYRQDMIENCQIQ